MRKRNIIVYKLNKKYCCMTHKFGIKVPTSVNQAYEIKYKTGTEFWRNSIATEMLKANVAYVEKEETP